MVFCLELQGFEKLDIELDAPMVHKPNTRWIKIILILF
jgi:hypothetical protein